MAQQITAEETRLFGEIRNELQDLQIEFCFAILDNNAESDRKLAKRIESLNGHVERANAVLTRRNTYGIFKSVLTALPTKNRDLMLGIQLMHRLVANV